jgi:DUF1680 family protein
MTVVRSVFPVCTTLATAALAATAPTPREQPLLCGLRAVPFTAVAIQDAFWTPRQAANRTVSIPVNLENLEKAGNLGNLRLAAEKATSGFRGPVFMDSDVYKALEAASYSLATHPDPDLEGRLDEIIALIAAAQQPDGYLNTHFTVATPDKRWQNLRDWHELYCAGHLFEAAVAHFQATGKRTLLEVASRLADHIDTVFGPPPKRLGYPGHPEIELALVKLWQATGERRYIELARFFVENRGQRFFASEHNTPPDRYDGSYWQDDVPIADQRSIKGHAVRAAYLMSGVTDVAAETHDPSLLRMLARVWRNTVEKNLYLTGGIGPSAHNEGFTVDYDLPNLSAYQETCATIALAQWSHRLALLYGDAAYADVLERALYNGTLAGVSQDGSRFFYVNPLASVGHHHRSPWFGCACCPPNVARTLASLGGYAYATGSDGLWVTLYLQGTAKVTVGTTPVTLTVTTDYPWDGKVLLRLELAQPEPFGLHLRVPGWCRGARVVVNGAAVAQPVLERGYCVIDRTWSVGDTVALDLPMPVERIAAHPRVAADQGLYAIQRGPLVYCLEAVDQPEPLADLYLPLDAELLAERVPELLGGVVAVKGMACANDNADWRRTLYRAVSAPRRVPVTAVPYYAWDNRAAGAMQVWLPAAPVSLPAGGIERQAAVTVSFANSNCQPQGINDGSEPKSSGEQPAALCHWWPHKGGDEWAQYTWAHPQAIAGVRVYWFDDTGRGACRLPVSWHVEYLEGTAWRPVAALGEYPIAMDRWCEARFAPVISTALRLCVRLPPEWAAGVHEWAVIEAEDE